jgi:hypothetical protein
MPVGNTHVTNTNPSVHPSINSANSYRIDHYTNTLSPAKSHELSHPKTEMKQEARSMFVSY